MVAKINSGKIPPEKGDGDKPIYSVKPENRINPSRDENNSALVQNNQVKPENTVEKDNRVTPVSGEDAEVKTTTASETSNGLGVARRSISGPTEHLTALGELSRGITGDPVNRQPAEIQMIEADSSPVQTQEMNVNNIESGDVYGNQEQIPVNDLQQSAYPGYEAGVVSEQPAYPGYETGVNFEQELQHNPQALNNYQQLSEEERETLASVNNSVNNAAAENAMQFQNSDPYQMNPAAPQAGAVDPRVAYLLESGQLNGQTDREGNTLINNLAAMSEQEFPPELNQNHIMNQTLEHITNPTAIHQGNRGSCATAVAQYQLAATSPADYVNVVSGLTSAGGNVSEAYGGGDIARGNDLLYQDGSGRDDVSRIFQASMLDYGHGDMRYSNELDVAYSPTDLFDTPAQTGLNYALYDDMSNSILPDQLTVRTPQEAGSYDMVHSEISNALDADCPVPVSLNWSQDENNMHSRHKLLVTHMDDEHVYLYNPWGPAENGSQPGDALPERELVDVTGDGIGDSGYVRMPVATFDENLVAYHVPADTGNQEAMDNLRNTLYTQFS
jgi:hypothetical protein